MKKILLLFAAIVICFTCFCQENSKIDLDLQTEMQLKNGGELIKINIVMKEQYNQQVLRSKASTYHLREEKRTFVVNELIRHAKETQKEVMNYLDHFAKTKALAGSRLFGFLMELVAMLPKK